MAKEIRMMDIMFQDPNNTFNAGGNVEGRVYLDVSQEIKIKSVKLQLQGVTRVTWDENKSYTKGSASKTSHKNVSVCFDTTVVIKGSPMTLAPGRYDWHFSESIPAFCPGTFEGHWGRVQYFAKLNIQRSFSKSDIDLVKNFMVRGVLDLNTENDAKVGVANESETTAGFLCCKSGPIVGRIQLNKKGYVAPEGLPFTVDVQNNSRSKCAIKVILLQQAVFRADSQTKRTNNPLKGISYKSVVAGGGNIHWEDQLRSVPPVQPSHLGGGCKNIDVKYIVMLVVTPSGAGSEMEVPIEVILGTVPLRKAESGTPMLTVKAAASRAEGHKGLKCSPRPKRTARSGDITPAT